MAGPRERFFDRIGKPIGLQLYTLGDEPEKDLDTVLSKLAAIGYRDIELPQLYGRSPADLRAAADNAGLRLSSFHIPAPGLAPPGAITLGSPAREIADMLGALGMFTAILPITPFPADFRRKDGEDFPTMFTRALTEGGADHWKRTADMLNARALALKPFGIQLGYHNHNLEFAPVGDTTGWDLLVENTDPSLVHFEVDLGWVAAAGLDPATFLQQQAGRVRWLHLKDLKASTKTNFALTMDPTEIGSGEQDWANILTAAEAAGVEHYYVEQEPPFAMPRMESAKRSYAFLSQLET